MPKFLDYHAQMPPMPPEAVQHITEAARAGQPDEFGVKPINVFTGTAGQSHCLTEASNADAICQSHAAKGITLGQGDVYEVNSLV